MKLYKIYSHQFLFILFVAFLGFTACKKENLPVKPQSSPFSAAMKNTTSFTAAGGKDTGVVSAGADGWWVTIPSTSTAWCSVSKMYGSGDFLLPVTIKANTTGAPRQVVLTLSPTYSLPPISITLSQSN
jgi:hypothetical protein